MSTPMPIRSAWLQRLCSVAAAAFALTLGGVLFDMPVAAAKLSAEVMAQLPHSGVAYPVTAVLLNFRGYDTLLEIGVLLLAVFGALVPFGTSRPMSTQNTITTNPLLASLVRTLVPLMLLIAAYLLWVGSHRAGGAFQAAAVLAAAGVLLRLAGMLPMSVSASLWRRAGLVMGFVVFIAVSLASILAGGTFLEYPRAWAGELILLIETALTVSVGLTLLTLFASPPAASQESIES